jgi:serine/threonine protein kinase
MRIGDFLRDETDGGGRFRIDDLVEASRSFQIVRCLDTERDDCAVYAKAPRYDEDEERAEAREDWRAALDFEAEVLERDIDGLPTFVERLEVATEDDAGEPVLVYESFEGDTLRNFVAKRPAGTISIDMLLGVVRQVAEICAELHDAGLVYRDLDPRHVIVDEDGEFVGAVGTGNVAEMQEPPNPVASRLADAPYVAPEARSERSGETLTPAVDVYGLAAMASYAFTGQETTTAVESPLIGEAYEALETVMVDGLDHFVAMGLQPVAKHRVDLDELIEHAHELGLAELSNETVRDELGMKPIPEPWAGAEPPETNRGEKSSLSAGPLISVSNDDSSGPSGGRPGPFGELSGDGPPGPSGNRPGPAGDLSDAPGSPEDVEGVKSAPVREFLGESEADEAPPSPSGVDDETDEDDEADPRTDGGGEPVREISMVDENLEAEGTAPEPAEPQADGPAIDWEKRAEESPLPPLTELPLKWRLALGIGVPVLGVAIVAALGLLGVY